jgi:ketosteroid isomerase-like protein
MVTKEAALRLAEEWVEAWNAHDLDAILEHYAEDVVLTSPVVIERLNDASGTVRGKAALRDYFRRGLDANPKLAFELRDVMWGVTSVVLYYRNQRGSMTGEVMELGKDGKVSRVLANYSG